MKQNEEIIASLGCGRLGCAMIRELSDDPTNPRPTLTLMLPEDAEHPSARSFTLENSDHVKQLYNLLKVYFDHAS